MSTRAAVTKVLFYVLAHLGPVKLSADKFEAFALFWVSGSWDVIVKLDDMQLKGGVVWYIECVRESQVSLVIGELG